MVTLRPRSVVGPRDELWAPPRPTIPLLLSGNEITPYVRLFGREGDGIDPMSVVGRSGYGVWEATTNFALNGGLESGILFNSISGITGGDTAQDLTKSKFGSASIRHAVGGASGGRFFQTEVGTAAEGEVWSASGWVYHEEAGPIDFRAGVNFRNDGSGAGTSLGVSEGDAFSVPPFTWTYIYAAGKTAPEDTARAWCRLNCESQITFWADGGQSELQPIPTPYVETDGAAASRSGAGMQLPGASSYITPTQGWQMYLMRMGWAHDASPGNNPTLMMWGDDDSNRLSLLFNETADTWETRRFASGAGASAALEASFERDDIESVLMAWTPTTAGISVNGSAFETEANSSIPTLSETEMTIGYDGQIFDSGLARQMDSTILAFALGRGTLTDANAAALNQILRRIYQDPELVHEEAFPGNCTLVWPGGSPYAFDMRGR